MTENEYQAKKFQSTPSVGRATIDLASARYSYTISIHALRGEGDKVIIDIIYTQAISIHALRGEGDELPAV